MHGTPRQLPHCIAALDSSRRRVSACSCVLYVFVPGCVDCVGRRGALPCTAPLGLLGVGLRLGWLRQESDVWSLLGRLLPVWPCPWPVSL